MMPRVRAADVWAPSRASACQHVPPGPADREIATAKSADYAHSSDGRRGTQSASETGRAAALSTAIAPVNYRTKHRRFLLRATVAGSALVAACVARDPSDEDAGGFPMSDQPIPPGGLGSSASTQPSPDGGTSGDAGGLPESGNELDAGHASTTSDDANVSQESGSELDAGSESISEVDPFVRTKLVGS
jgi:hypothetical protein